MNFNAARATSFRHAAAAAGRQKVPEVKVHKLVQLLRVLFKVVQRAVYSQISNTQISDNSQINNNFSMFVHFRVK